jgi:hypothetical protein
MDSKLKRRLSSAVQVTVTGGLAAWECVQLHGYGVPLLLMTACGLAVWSALLSLWGQVARAAATTTHRCTAPGCDFTVRLRHASAVDNRRWQETAAAHPAHRP